MKTVFSRYLKRLHGVKYVRVYALCTARPPGLRYAVHNSKEERESHENFNRYRHEPLYRINVYPTAALLKKERDARDAPKGGQ